MESISVDFIDECISGIIDEIAILEDEDYDDTENNIINTKQLTHVLPIGYEKLNIAMKDVNSHVEKNLSLPSGIINSFINLPHKINIKQEHTTTSTTNISDEDTNVRRSNRAGAASGDEEILSPTSKNVSPTSDRRTRSTLKRKKSKEKDSESEYQIEDESEIEDETSSERNERKTRRKSRRLTVKIPKKRGRPKGKSNKKIKVEKVVVGTGSVTGGGEAGTPSGRVTRSTRTRGRGRGRGRGKKK